MLAKDISNYGGPHVNVAPVADPQAEVDAAIYDRQSEDTAQMTRTVTKARVWFDTDAAAAPFNYAAADVNHESIWGSGSAQKPTVRKTAVGRYTITYATTFTDALGVVESVNFRTATVTVMSNDAGDVMQGQPLTISANVATIKVESPHATLADAGNNSGNDIRVMVELS